MCQADFQWISWMLTDDVLACVSACLIGCVGVSDAPVFPESYFLSDLLVVCV